MAWTTLPTYTDGTTLTAAQLNAIVANINTTAPAVATAAGRLIVTTGANSISQRVPTRIKTPGGAQGTTSTTFTDLTTTGPNATGLTTGTSAIYSVSAFMLSTVAQAGAYMGVTVSGATTLAASLLDSMRVISEVAGVNQKMSYFSMYTTLTAGSNNFGCKYASTSGASTATFDEREITVIPL